MSDGLEEIVDSLKKQESRLGGQLGDLNQQVQSVEEELKRIREALTALSGKATKQPKSRESKQPSKKSKKPSATRADVSDIMHTILSKEGACTEVELKEKVYQAVENLGKSKLGLALRIKEAAKEDRFKQSEGSLKLVDAG